MNTYDFTYSFICNTYGYTYTGKHSKTLRGRFEIA